MAAPVFDEIYSQEESIQLLTSARNSQTIVPGAGAAVAITLKTPSIIVNNTANGGNIAYLLVDDVAPNYTIERFEAGQEKRRRATMIGGAGEGTTVATILVLES